MATSDNKTLEFLIKFRNEADQEINNLKGQLGDVAKGHEEVAKSALDHEEANKHLQDSFVQAGVAVVAFYGEVKALLGLTDDFAKFQEELAHVGLATSQTGQDLTDLGKDVRDYSAQNSQTTEELLKLSEAAAQLGIKGPQAIVDYSATIATLAETVSVSSGEIQQSFNRILSVTGEGAGGVDGLANSIVALQGKVVGSAPEVLDLTNKMALAFSRFGGTAQDALSFGALLSDLGVRSGTAAAAVQTAMGDIDAAAHNSQTELNAFSVITGKSSDEFKKLAQSAPLQALGEFLKGIKALKEGGQDFLPVLAALQLGDGQTANVIGQLSEKYEKLAQVQAVVAGQFKDGTALAEGQAKLDAVLQDVLDVTANDFKNIKVQIGASVSEGFIPLLHVLQDGLQAFVKFDNATHGVASEVVELIGVLTLLGTGVAVVTTLITLMGAAGKAAWISFLGPVGTVIAIIGSVIIFFKALYDNVAVVKDAFNFVGKSALDAFDAVKKFLGFGPPPKDTLDFNKQLAASFKDNENALHNLITAKDADIKLSLGAVHEAGNRVLQDTQDRIKALNDEIAALKARSAAIQQNAHYDPNVAGSGNRAALSQLPAISNETKQRQAELDGLEAKARSLSLVVGATNFSADFIAKAKEALGYVNAAIAASRARGAEDIKATAEERNYALELAATTRESREQVSEAGLFNEALLRAKLIHEAALKIRTADKDVNIVVRQEIEKIVASERERLALTAAYTALDQFAKPIRDSKLLLAGLDEIIKKRKEAGDPIPQEQIDAVRANTPEANQQRSVLSGGIGDAARDSEADAIKAAELNKLAILNQSHTFLNTSEEEYQKQRLSITQKAEADIRAVYLRGVTDRAGILSGTSGAASLAASTALIEAENRKQLFDYKDLYANLGLSAQAYQEGALEIVLKGNTDIVAAQQAAIKQREDLDKSIGFGKGNNPLQQDDLGSKNSQIDQEALDQHRLLDASKEFALAKLTDQQATGLALITGDQDIFDRRLQAQQDYQARSDEIDETAATKKRQAELAQQQVTVQGFQSASNSVLGVLETSVGKQSAIYKAAFVANQAFAVASAVINIQKAISDGFATGTSIYTKLANVAIIISQTASIVSAIQNVKLALADGGQVSGPGGPRDDKIAAFLSNGEFVVNAAATKKNLPLLEHINAQKFADGGFVGGGSSPTSAQPIMGRDIFHQTNSTGGVNVTNSFTFNGPPPTDKQSQKDLVDMIDKKTEETTLRILTEQMRQGGKLENVKGRTR